MYTPKHHKRHFSGRKIAVQAAKLGPDQINIGHTLLQASKVSEYRFQTARAFAEAIEAPVVS